MPYCRNCGAELQPEDKFCPNCGAQLIPTSPQPVVAERKEIAKEGVEPVKAISPSTKTTESAKTKHTVQGVLSILVGIGGLLMLFMEATPADVTYAAASFIIAGAITASLGMKAYDLGDSFGKVGMVLALILVLIGLLILLLL